MDALFVVLAVAGVLIAIATIVAARWRERKRREALQQVAQQLGLEFFPQGDPVLIDQLERFQLFSKGHGKRIRNMIHGETEDVDLGIFDYQYTTGSGKNAHTWVQTVIAFQSPKLQLPQFVMRPEHLFDRLGAVLGYEDIDFDSHPVFSKMFLLRGDDELRIREVFHSDVLTFLESLPGISLEGADDRLIFFRAGKRVKPQEVQQLMEEGFRVYSLLHQ